MILVRALQLQCPLPMANQSTPYPVHIDQPPPADCFLLRDELLAFGGHNIVGERRSQILRYHAYSFQKYPFDYQDGCDH
jgi:hypothetical protein